MQVRTAYLVGETWCALVEIKSVVAMLFIWKPFPDETRGPRRKMVETGVFGVETSTTRPPTESTTTVAK